MNTHQISLLFLLFLPLLPSPCVAQKVHRREWPPPAHRESPAPHESIELRTFELSRDQPFHDRLPSLDTFLISLPHPAGGLTTFQCWPAPVLAPALAARYPHIQTYAGYAVEYPRVRLRMELTPRGLSAQVLASGGDYFIEPAAAGNPAPYRVYFRRDLPAGPGAACVAEPVSGPDFRSPSPPPLPLGDTLRTYRLAVAATGEFSQFHGAAVEGVLAAIVTIVNRVNGIYERDLALRLQLVEGNDQLIFLDPQTDPYDKDRERQQNPAVLDERIGVGNYDIGHVFSVTAQVSRAEVASACINGQKARAVSSLAMPTGDPFAVDVVAHEIGHQLGANHTFNKCGVLQGAIPVEPGSGSTIMGWPGLCGADDLQAHADAYFHSVSIAEIARYTRQGGGAGCGAPTLLANTPPVAYAGAGDLVIPIGTPFELAGSAFDPDGDDLSYAWEETDQGPSTPIGDPAGTAPLFRSRPPTADSVRSFPRLPELLSNTAPFGETLPRESRPLRFRLTVRDQRGGVAWDSLALTATGQAGPFRVLAQNEPTPWQAGARVRVEWDVAGTDRAPVNATAVDLLLSADGGLSFPIRLAAGAPNTGLADLRLPDDLSGDHFRIKIKAVNNVFFDINDADFTIKPVATAVTPVEGGIGDLKLFPNPAKELVVLRFDLSGAASLNVEIWAVTGQPLRRYALGRRPAGRQDVRLDLGGLAAGMYLVHVRDEMGRLGKGLRLVRVE